MIPNATEISERPPLGLPQGSVRALLALMVVLVIVVEVIRNVAIEVIWTETLMIVLAHYFSSRRFIQLPPEVVRRLQDEGHLERDSHPLFLPRKGIAAMIVGTFVLLAVFLYSQGRLFHYESASILVTVFAYLIGIVGRHAWDWWNRDKEVIKTNWWDDSKAAVVLIVLATTAVAYLTNCQGWLPKPFIVAAMGLVLFYFGSR